MSKFITNFLKTCHPETQEIVRNAWAALQARDITRSQWQDVVRGCIAEEMEITVLDKQDKVKTHVLLTGRTYLR